jgi:hypothetical protein
MKTIFGGSHHQMDVATIKHHTTGYCTPNTFHVFLTQPTLFTHSNAQPHYTRKCIRSCTPNTLALCCLPRSTLVKNHRRTGIACFQLWGIVMVDHRKVNTEAKGFHLNKGQRGIMLKWEGKECETRRQKFIIQKLQSAKKKLKSVWKIHEVVIHKGTLSWNWDVPHVNLVKKNNELIEMIHEIGRAL